MGEKRNVHRLLVGKPEGKRPRNLWKICRNMHLSGEFHGQNGWKKGKCLVIIVFVACLACCSALKMEAVLSFKTLCELLADTP
jgi:hypothetical protein